MRSRLGRLRNRLRRLLLLLLLLLLRLRWCGSDGESVVPVGGKDCGARDAVVAWEVLFCNSFGCNWSGGADRRAWVQCFVPRDAAAAGAEHHGGRPVGTDVSAANAGAAEGAGRDRGDGRGDDAGDGAAVDGELGEDDGPSAGVVEGG